MQRCITGVAGFILGASLGLIYSQTPREADTAPRPKAHGTRVTVGLRDPMTPKLAQEIVKSFGGQVLNMAPNGSPVLILLKPGQTLEQVRKANPRIAYVEAEIAMGIPGPERTFAMIVPAPSRPKAPR